MALYQMVERLTYVVDALIDLQEQIKDRVVKTAEGGDLRAALERFNDDLEAFRKTVVATRKGGFLAGEEQLREELTSLYGAVNGYEGQPTESQIRYMAVLEKRLAEAEERFEALISSNVEPLNARLLPSGAEPLVRMSKAEWEAKEKGK